MLFVKIDSVKILELQTMLCRTNKKDALSCLLYEVIFLLDNNCLGNNIWINIFSKV